MRQLAIILFFFPLLAGAQEGYLIEGVIHLAKDWNPIIYLSALETMDDQFSVSEDMIIAQAPISQDGSFSLVADYLPPGDRLYRLHVSKMGDPASTIVIGGREENHVHFAMSPGDTIHVTHGDSSRVFGGLAIAGNAANVCMTKVNGHIATLRHQPSGTAASAKIKQAQVRSELESVLRDCPSALGKLYAAHALMEKYEDAELVEYLMVIRKMASIKESPYFETFDRRVELAAMNYNLLPSRVSGPWAWLLVLPVIGALWYWYFRRRRNHPEEAMMALSVQERRVFALLVNGCSNKEISSELNIGVSTVKSHVHRIYNKLGIQSRKEAIRYKEFVS